MLIPSTSKTNLGKEFIASTLYDIKAIFLRLATKVLEKKLLELVKFISLNEVKAWFRSINFFV